MWRFLAAVMGRKKRRPVSAATKPAPSSTETKPEQLSAWEFAKNKGNLLYVQNQYDNALVQYMAAIEILKLDSSVGGLFCGSTKLKFALVGMHMIILIEITRTQKKYTFVRNY